MDATAVTKFFKDIKFFVNKCDRPDKKEFIKVSSRRSPDPAETRKSVFRHVGRCTRLSSIH